MGRVFACSVGPHILSSGVPVWSWSRTAVCVVHAGPPIICPRAANCLLSHCACLLQLCLHQPGSDHSLPPAGPNQGPEPSLSILTAPTHTHIQAFIKVNMIPNDPRRLPDSSSVCPVTHVAQRYGDCSGISAVLRFCQRASRSNQRVKGFGSLAVIIAG